MTRVAKLYDRVRSGSTPRFAELQMLAGAFGFQLVRVAGSHHIYRHPEVRSSLNLQPHGSEAKAYQVRQFLAMIDENDLTLEDGR